MTAEVRRDWSADRLYLAAVGGSTLLMLALSWPLWVTGGAIPRVPFVGGLHEAPPAISWLRFVALALVVVCAALGPGVRVASGCAFLLIVPSVLEDQHRFQPWVYQYAMTALAFATLPGARALACARLFLIALYFHSGLSKLDASFGRGLGLTFLETIARPFGLFPREWPPGVRAAAVLAMPAAELLIAVGLVMPVTRRIAFLGASALHLVLIGVLGPWALDHSTIVLVWNGALIVEGYALFGRRDDAPPDDVEAGGRLAGVTRMVFALAAALPFGERWGLFDTWPSFALYASHAERTYLILPVVALDGLPDSARSHLKPLVGGDYWLDFNGWSRAERGTPVYPQDRAVNGLAEGTVARYGGDHSAVVVHEGRADRWTGRRRESVSRGLGAIRAWGDHYQLNAHPSP